MSTRIVIKRTYSPKVTTGCAELWSDGRLVFEFATVELPWVDNRVGKSCIPEGTYKAKKHIAPSKGNSIWLQDVPGRSEILIHTANFVRELRGCIAPGYSHKDIDNDGVIDVTESRKCMNYIYLLSAKDVTVDITKSEAVFNSKSFPFY